MHEPGPGHLDLFSGIGGFALAAGWAGFRTIAFSEIDPYASAVLKKHWPDVPKHGDVRGLDGGRFRGISLLTAGVPCQPASSAGQRRGPSDDRWLWPEALRILGEAKPTFAVFENPTGILALNDGVEFERLLSAMEGHGYAVQPIIIPAVAVDARHRRDRVWIVAHAESIRRPQTAERRESSKPIAELCGQAIPNTGHGRPRSESEGQPGMQTAGSFIGYHWLPEAESGVGRVADGIPNRAYRLKGLGNSIVPQVAFQILREIRKLI